jgi:lysozyme
VSKAKVAAGGALAAVLALAAVVVSKWEGTEYSVYIDPVGNPTVCTGHMLPKDTDLTRKYTKAECDALLREDLAEANGYVVRCIKTPMTTGQQAALISATFNIGPRVVCGSTLQRKANAGDWAGACEELKRWSRAGGRVVKGLVYRRADEFRMCMGEA